MMTRNIMMAVAIVGLSPALATELPKEVKCRFKANVIGTQTGDELDAADVYGIGRWEETQTPGDRDCGQVKLPPMRPSHCYGLSESNRTFILSTGYCVEADQDGDKIIWKMDPTKNDQFYTVASGTSQILMGSGKYAGLSGKSKWQCTYGASALKYNALCHFEQTLEFPAKD